MSGQERELKPVAEEHVRLKEPVKELSLDKAVLPDARSKKLRADTHEGDCDDGDPLRLPAYSHDARTRRLDGRVERSLPVVPGGENGVADLAAATRQDRRPPSGALPPPAAQRAVEKEE